MTHMWPWAVPTYSFSVLTGAFYPLVTLVLTGGSSSDLGPFSHCLTPLQPSPPSHAFTHTPHTAGEGGGGGRLLTVLKILNLWKYQLLLSILYIRKYITLKQSWRIQKKRFKGYECWKICEPWNKMVIKELLGTHSHLACEPSVTAPNFGLLELPNFTDYIDLSSNVFNMY